MKAANIGDHGIIGNMRSAALVNVFGGIDFFCFPEFDSPSLFASLLDTKQGGCFSLCPVDQDLTGRQVYLPDTNVLLTRFLSDSSSLEVYDFMPVSESGSQHCIMRHVRAAHGDTEVQLHCQPAFDYARTHHRVSETPQGAIFRSESENLPAMRLTSSVSLQITENAATARFVLKRGETASFIFSSAEDEIAEACSSHVSQQLAATIDYRGTWATRSHYKGRWREVVMRSALTLKLLTSLKHGSILAAPTFGLPEAIGGKRNWDYRYVWMRDASFTTYAFSRLGYVEEGRRFERWNADIGAFVQYKGAAEVDASTLLMPLLRFISVNDPRWLSTLNVIERELATETAVRRYSSDSAVDGLPGHEGSFTACAFWLVEAKARSHQVREARLLFEKLLSHANPVGLYAEEMNSAGQHLGNFPQALSHLALISAATYLNRCMDPLPEDLWS